MKKMPYLADIQPAINPVDQTAKSNEESKEQGKRSPDIFTDIFQSDPLRNKTLSKISEKYSEHSNVISFGAGNSQV